MSEKRPGIPPELLKKEDSPENNTADIEKKDEQEEAEKYFERLFEAYFSGIDLTHHTKNNLQIKAERYNQLVRNLDSGFHHLTQWQKKLIKILIVEKAGLGEKTEEQKPTTETTNSTPDKTTELKINKEKKELDFSFSAEDLFGALKEKSGSRVPTEQIVENLIANIKTLSNGKILPEDIKYTNFSEEELDSERGKIKKYVFFCHVKIGEKRERTVKCTLNFVPLLTGRPGSQTKELVPKFFVSGFKK